WPPRSPRACSSTGPADTRVCRRRIPVTAVPEWRFERGGRPFVDKALSWRTGHHQAFRRRATVRSRGFQQCGECAEKARPPAYFSPCPQHLPPWLRTGRREADGMSSGAISPAASQFVPSSSGDPDGWQTERGQTDRSLTELLDVLDRADAM